MLSNTINKYSNYSIKFILEQLVLNFYWTVFVLKLNEHNNLNIIIITIDTYNSLFVFQCWMEANTAPKIGPRKIAFDKYRNIIIKSMLDQSDASKVD